MTVGQHFDQLKGLADMLIAPSLTGLTPNTEWERLYQEFRKGTTKVGASHRTTSASSEHGYSYTTLSTPS